MRRSDVKDYPPLLLVGASVWHLVFVSRLKEGDLGACDPDGNVIYISLNQDKSEMEDTIEHELLHALTFENGCELTHPMVYKLADHICEMRKQLGYSKNKTARYAKK